MSVRFWGVRGSIATPGVDTLRYGGNTACIEVRCGDALLILDAGTGLRPLGDALGAAGLPVDAEIFCTHTHIDHLCGFPFFAPCFDARTRLRLWAGHLAPPQSLREVYRTTLTAPLFPDLMDHLPATLEFREFAAGDSLSPRPGLIVETAPLNHPGGATGYRFEWGGKSVAYITDTEHRGEALDPNVLRLVDRADIMIYDANYTDEDYPQHVGWGHSTWQEGVRLADKALVGTLVVFHHDPARTDEMLDEIAAAAESRRSGTVVAREGLVLTA
jgi:phosphoribosyl 1,2-cyclic phosphodiesterase